MRLCDQWNQSSTQAISNRQKKLDNFATKTCSFHIANISDR